MLNLNNHIRIELMTKLEGSIRWFLSLEKWRSFQTPRSVFKLSTLAVILGNLFIFYLVRTRKKPFKLNLLCRPEKRNG